MGFLSGSTTFQRYRITEDPTSEFGESHLECLAQHAIRTNRAQLIEQPAIGFCAGTHIFDTQFEYAKNIIGESMHFGIRVDSIAVPGPIKNAWMKIELAGIMGDDAGKRPTKSQREEAKDAVEARCAAEAEKGNFLRMSETSVLWDAPTGTILLGSTSEKSNDACLDLLNRAFGLEVCCVTSGKLAEEWAEDTDQHKALCDTGPTPFLPDQEASQVVWWNGMPDNYDYLGNEFLLWLWWKWETDSNVLIPSDGSEISGMFARSLTLDCPFGEHGKESISSDSPVALPEAAMAIRMGKLPRKAGLTLVRDDQQFDLSLQAETFAISSARISTPANLSAERGDLTDRIESLRQMIDTVDLLFEMFCEDRLATSWSSTTSAISQWLQQDKAIRIRKAA